MWRQNVDIKLSRKVEESHLFFFDNMERNIIVLQITVFKIDSNVRKSEYIFSLSIIAEM